MASADRVRRLVALVFGVLLLGVSPAMAESPFSRWAAIVVAGDWHAHSGGPSEAFDNARRDVSKELVRMGFAPENLKQFSVRPERYKDTNPAKTEPKVIYDALVSLTAKAPDGCLVYFTSHGAPTGVVVDQSILPPGILGTMLDRTCGPRPTIVVISACYSGIFVPELGSDNRMVLTAARPDRTSFGCGESDKYPYFDDCFLQTTPQAKDFPSLGSQIQACVADREIKEKMAPPSEPQLYIGPQLRPMLPLYPLPPPGATKGG
ncbi:MAG: peptidase C13 [Alphaproteobacteria bacterium PA2]|nr:MAG: peptidase C13 [Alphaproteobacteria bacterium PA2]